VNVTDPIRRVARRQPRDPAVVDGDRVATYDELWSAVTSVARWFRGRNLAPGDRVLLWIPNGFSFLAVHLGAMAAGLLSIPIKAENGPAEFHFAVADAAPRLLIADRALLARLPEGPPLDCVAVDELPLAAGLCVDDEPEPVGGDHPATAIYSYVFGEGRPYAAVLTHAALVFLAESCGPFFLYDRGDRLLVLLPMLHVFALGNILPALYCGATVFVGNPSRPRAILDLMTAHRITHMPSVPQILDQLARVYVPGRHDLSAIKEITSGADFLPAATHERIEATLRAPIFQGYGMTETCPLISNPPGGDNRFGTLGIAIHSRIDFRIADSTGAEARPGTVGEIELRTPGAMAGYLGAPEATSRLVRDGWVRSGDLGWVDDRGYLHFERLLKPIVNISGNKIDPREVAATIEKMEGIESATVSGVTVPSPTGIPDVILKADVQVDPRASVVERDIRAHCRTWLAPYKVPQRVELRP